VVRPSLKCLLTSTLWCPLDKGCFQPLSSDPKIELECHGLHYINSIPITRNLYKLQFLAAIHKIRVKTKHNRGQRVHTQEPKPATQHKNKITRAKNTQSYKNNSNLCLDLIRTIRTCVAECWIVERLLVCLCDEQVCHGGSFIAPKGTIIVAPSSENLLKIYRSLGHRTKSCSSILRI
jgi:hypothetical protein